MSQVKISRLTLTFTSQNPHRIHLHITSKSEHATYTHNITNIENTSLSLTSLTYKVALRCSAQTGRPQVIGNYFAILIPVRLNPYHSLCVCVCSPHTLLIHPPFPKCHFSRSIIANYIQDAKLNRCISFTRTSHIHTISRAYSQHRTT